MTFDPKITPGPWRYDYEGHSDCDGACIGADGKEVIKACCDWWEGLLWVDIGEHDAKAIAAVPELLAVYKEAKSLVCIYNDLSEMAKLKRVIKKLESRSNERS